MKILEKEIGLREETRSLEQARPALVEKDYGQQVDPLATTQHELAQRVADVSGRIQELENADVFGREIMLLERVEQVMHEAHQLLALPETGPPTVAAETEAIELLLQARRVNPSGGGGGGASPGGGGSGDTEQAALALLGTGNEQNARPQPRQVSQATGVAGSDLPAEYRSGLDAFFGALESQGRD